MTGGKDMLPGPPSIWVSQHEWITASNGAHKVRYQPIRRPVAAADDVAGPSSRDGHACPARDRATIARGHDFGAGLRGAIGINTAETVVLSIRPMPLTVLVHLVGGDHQDGTDRWACTRRL